MPRQADRWEVVDLFAPRDAATATRAVVVLLSIAALVTGAYLVAFPPAGGVLAAGLGAVAACLVCATWLGRHHRSGRTPPLGLWPALGGLSVAAIAALNVATHDSSTAAQVFFLLPVLFGASQLRSRAAWCFTGSAVVGEAATALALLPAQEALVDLVHVSGVACGMTALLARSGSRTDRLLAELRHQAAVDPLTGLVTRRVLDDAATSALAAAGTGEGTALAVVDLDHFKGVNDVHGHPAGDAALVHVAGLLRAVEGDAVVSRLGGDELALLLPGCSLDRATEHLREMAQRVRSTPLRLCDEHVVTLTVSVGVAHAPRHAVDLPSLYRAADRALYDAKRAGRDRVAVASGPATVPQARRPEVPAR